MKGRHSDKMDDEEGNVDNFRVNIVTNMWYKAYSHLAWVECGRAFCIQKVLE